MATFIFKFFQKKAFILSTIVLFLANYAPAQDAFYEAQDAAAGRPFDSWNVVGTWIGGSVPTCTGHSSIQITIPNGVILSTSGEHIDLSTCQVEIIIEAGGTLRIRDQSGVTPNGSTLSLGTGSTIQIADGGTVETSNGGGGTSAADNNIEIGGNTVWNGEIDGDITPAAGETATINGSGIVLPIELLYFTVSEKDNAAEIKWLPLLKSRTITSLFSNQMTE